MRRVDAWVAVVLMVALGLGSSQISGTYASFAVPTDNPSNSFSAYADWRPPITARATVVKSQGGIPGFVRAGGTYTVIASVADDPSSNPPAGLGTVSTNVGSVTAGSAAVAMSSSPQTVWSLPYTHVSAQQVVPAGRAAGTYTGLVAADDLATPSNTAAAFDFPVVVDNTAPTRTAATLTNGGIAGRADARDRVTFLWSEVIDPQSVLAGWSGASTPVTVQISNGNGTRGDTITVRNAANTAQLPLGSIELKARDYVTAATNFGGPANPSRSTMSWNPATGSISVVLGAADTPATVSAAGTSSGTFEWIPQAVYDRAGNLANTTAYTEPGGVDRDL